MTAAAIAAAAVRREWGRSSPQTQAEKVHELTQAIAMLRRCGFTVAPAPPEAP